MTFSANSASKTIRCFIKKSFLSLPLTIWVSGACLSRLPQIKIELYFSFYVKDCLVSNLSVPNTEVPRSRCPGLDWLLTVRHRLLSSHLSARGQYKALKLKGARSNKSMSNYFYIRLKKRFLKCYEIIYFRFINDSCIRHESSLSFHQNLLKY